MTILSTTVTPTTAYLGNTITLYSEVSETIPSTHIAMWIIDFDETTDSSTMIWEFLNQDRVLNYEWSPFVHKMDMSSEVQINGSMLGEHTLTFILGQGQGGISIANNPELFTISDPINVSFKMHLYDKVKKLGNQWFYLKDEINTLLGGKEDNANKVTSLSSSSTDTQYPSAKAVYDAVNGFITPTNKNLITTSFTPSKLIKNSTAATINNHNSFTVAHSVREKTEPGHLIFDSPGYIIFDFGCQNNEYYEFDITTSRGYLNIYDSTLTKEYCELYRDDTYTIKITHDELLIVKGTTVDGTTVVDISKSNGILIFDASGVCQVDFSNKKWYHEATFFDKIYPIGAVHITTNSVNPSNYFDGEWERIQDAFLLASGTTYENGSTGGSATVTLTASQSGLPAHNHTYAHTDTTYKANTTSRKPGTATAANYVTSITGTANNTTKTSSNNTAQNAAEAHNNMPPYLAVYMWERVG